MESPVSCSYCSAIDRLHAVFSWVSVVRGGTFYRQSVNRRRGVRWTTSSPTSRLHKKELMCARWCKLYLTSISWSSPWEFSNSFLIQKLWAPERGFLPIFWKPKIDKIFPLEVPQLLKENEIWKSPGGGSRYINKLQIAPLGIHIFLFMRPTGGSAGCLPYSTPSIDALSVGLTQVKP